MLGVNREISYCKFPSCTIVQETENCQTCLYCIAEPNYDKQTWSGNVRNCSDWVLNINYHTLHCLYSTRMYLIIWSGLILCHARTSWDLLLFACFHRVTLVMFLWVVFFPKSRQCVSARLSWTHCMVLLSCRLYLPSLQVRYHHPASSWGPTLSQSVVWHDMFAVVINYCTVNIEVVWSLTVIFDFDV